MTTPKKHADRAHALLSPSGSTRWLNCTASARLEDLEPEPPQSDFANEGTLAHEFAELFLRKELGIIYPSEYQCKKEELQAHKLYGGKAMLDYVDEYVAFCMEVYNRGRAQNLPTQMLVEAKLDLTAWVQESFGAVDDLIVVGTVLYIIDLKYGQGMVVDAKGNSQLRLYGLGGLQHAQNTLGVNITHVVLCIVQPRVYGHTSTETLAVQELLDWGEKIVKPKAIAAWNGEGQPCAGSWCKWCKVKHKCSSISKMANESAKVAFSEDAAALLTDAQVLENYKKLQMIQDWCSSVGDYVLQKALKGHKWDGYKVVRNTGRRAWKSEKEAIQGLQCLMLPEEHYMTKSLKTLTAIEKSIGKPTFRKFMSKLIVKKEGNLTLAPESDDRQPVTVETAAEVFSSNPVEYNTPEIKETVNKYLNI